MASMISHVVRELNEPIRGRPNLKDFPVKQEQLTSKPGWQFMAACGTAALWWLGGMTLKRGEEELDKQR
jgi:hypothetical protein